MKLLTIYVTLLCSIQLVAAPEVAKIGKSGSVASSPPPEADEGRKGNTVAKMMAMDLHVVPSAIENRAVPTNQWWTHLLVGETPGALWACPIVVEPKPESVDVFFPINWNGDGRGMVKGKPLRVHGIAKAIAKKKSEMTKAKDDPIVIADFEGDNYPKGWKTRGKAFGKSPAKGKLPGQTTVSAFAGKGLANSFLPNDQSEGTLTSPTISIDRDYLHFLIGGGNDPEKLVVNLLVKGKVVKTATGKNSEQLSAVSWDVKSLRGQKATLELVDSSTGGWGHLLADQFVLDNKETASPPPSDYVRVEHSKALRWGDWTMSFRHAADSGEGFDVTMGRGMPMCWFECRDTMPVLDIPQEAVFTDAKGSKVAVTSIAGSFTVSFDNRCFGVHLPKGSKVTQAQGGISLNLPANASFFTISALPNAKAFAKLAPAAFNVPRGSRVAYEYSSELASVKTRWSLELDSLDGGSKVAVQGWLPHHLRKTKQSLAFNGLEYATPRGKIRCAVGADFNVQFPFEGLLPMLPIPVKKVTDFEPKRLESLIANYKGKVKFGDDTYWGGKDLLRCAQAAVIAKQTKHPDAAVLKKQLASGLADWFTWTPGEKAHYFTWYPKWGGLAGFKDSYGSFQFTDQHFHFGYFTTSSAIMASLDPKFLDEYGDIARLVAKGYANWERDDKRFPSFRTFDFWEGHSWAGGFSSPGGNNQESSSEAIQSWAGIFLLGSALGDKEMQAAGAMGYAMERESTMDYWLDQPGFYGGKDASTLPPPYEKSVTGILFGNGIAYATYFSGDPAWIHGIQWFPASPWQDHLASDQKLSRHLYSSMMAERGDWFKREAERDPAKKDLDSNSINTMGPALGNVVMGFLALSDPEVALKKSKDLAEEGSSVVTDPEHIVPLAHAASRSVLGPRLLNYHTSLATSACFGELGNVRAVLYNPSAKPVTAKVFADGKEVSQVIVPPGKLLVHSVKIESK